MNWLLDSLLTVGQLGNQGQLLDSSALATNKASNWQGSHFPFFMFYLLTSIISQVDQNVEEQRSMGYDTGLYERVERKRQEIIDLCSPGCSIFWEF